MIVDVKCDDDTIQIANILQDVTTSEVEVKFLKRVKSNLYNFDDETSIVPKESVCGWYDTKNLEDTELYVKVSGGYDLVDDSEDEDFTCSESDEPESESESLIEEDEDGA